MRPYPSSFFIHLSNMYCTPTDALGRGASRPLTKGKNWRSMSFDNLIAWTVPPSGADKRESGANPERSGHCKRGAGRRRHCGDTRRRGPAESRKSGNLLSVQKDRCLPQKAACLFAAVWFDCAHGDEQSRFPPESGIFLSTAQKSLPGPGRVQFQPQ